MPGTFVIDCFRVKHIWPFAFLPLVLPAGIFFFFRFLTSDTLCTQTHRVGHHSRFGPDRLRHFVPECFYDFYNVFIWKARLHQLWCCNGVLCESSAVALVPPSFGFHEVLLTFCRHLQHQHCFGCQMAASVTTTWLWGMGPQAKWNNILKCHTSLGWEQLLERVFRINQTTLAQQWCTCSAVVW